MLKILLYIGVGSCFGGVSRYLLSQFIGSRMAGNAFPWGTFVVNVVGCFIIGLIYGLIGKGSSISEEMRAFLTVGFCGGFTTFSTFIYENQQLLNASGAFMMALYAGASFTIGLMCAYAGQWMARSI